MASILPVFTKDKASRHSRRIPLPRLNGPRTRYLFLCILALIILLNHRRLDTLRRDLGYLSRPIWDRPQKPFTIIPHFPPPHIHDDDETSQRAAWCKLHGWSARPERPLVIDAIPITTELDMLEIRMREYAPYVSTFVIVEADMTFAGTPKPLHFASNRSRFDTIAKEGGASILYVAVRDLQPNLPPGSFENEHKQRVTIGNAINTLSLPTGSLVIMSDVDEIISRNTLDLLTSCHVPQDLHLAVRNFRYGFNLPLRDEDYWRPRVVTVEKGQWIPYHHGRGSDNILPGSGWHCSFCFRTLEEMRAKMSGYGHNDRLRDNSLLEETVLRRRVCSGEDPFGMWPEAFTFRDLIAQSGPIREENSYLDLPVALGLYPDKFSYLLNEGCERPNE